LELEGARGLIHGPAALPPVPTEQDALWAAEQSEGFRKRKNPLPLLGHLGLMFQ
jgi:hypothetical protein